MFKISNILDNVLFLWLFALAVNIIAFFLLYYKIHPAARQLALHYNVLVGVDNYGAGYWLYAIPAVGLAAMAINFIFYRFVRKDNSFLSYLSAFVSAVMQIIILTAILFLARVN